MAETKAKPGLPNKRDRENALHVQNGILFSPKYLGESRVWGEADHSRMARDKSAAALLHRRG